MSKKKKTAVYQVYKGVDGDWRGRLVASNGKIVMDSAEGYKRKCDLLRMAQKYLACTIPVVED